MSHARRNRFRPDASRRPSLSFEPLESRLAMAVVVSEFMAENNSGLADFSGQPNDWIELKNTGAAAVDVSGWYLTDDAANLTKWQIPVTPQTTALAPGGYLLVFASDKNGVFGGELHANFKLALAGDDVILVQADGVTIASAYLDYQPQSPDVSFGDGLDRATVANEPLITAASNARVLPYTAPNAAVDDHWREIGFSDAAWIASKAAVGYDRDASPNNTLAAIIPQPLTAAQMNYNGTSGPVSAYVRVPFSVANPEQLTSLTLELRYDDAYIVYLNGHEIRRNGVNTTLQPGDTTELNSRLVRTDALVLSAPDVIDLTPWLDKLENGANVLAIYGANGTGSTERNDFLVYPLLSAQRATGGLPNAYLTSATPGRDNGAGWLGLVADTAFSVDRGFYTTPQSVAITTATPGATIRYTTDGTAPTATTGTVYTGPITVSATTTLRASAFKSGYLSSDVDTQTYIFLDDVLTQDAIGLPTYTTWGSPPDWEIDPDVVAAVGAAQLKSDLQAIPTVSLVMKWSDLFGDGTNHGIYTETTAWKNKSDPRATSIEFFTANTTEEFHADAAIEIQGHSSVTRWNTDKLSFQVKFKAPYGVTSLKAPELFANSTAPGAQTANSFDTLVLDAQYNYTWLTNTVQQYGVAKYINDQVISDYQNLSGGNAPHGRWVNLYINGLYWGIYNVHERPDDSFAKEYNGGAASDYYVVKAADGLVGHTAEYNWVDGGLTAEAAYAQFLAQVNDPVATLAEFQQVEALLDVDDFINYMIVSYYGGNYDWGQDNWYASINHLDAAGRWRFSSWDQEHSFPTDDNLALGETTYHVNYDSTVKNDLYGPTGIHRKLMASPEYKQRFSDRVQELMRNDGLLTPGPAAAVFQTRINELNRAINGESARWGDDRVAATPYTRANWLTNVNGVLNDFFPVRTGLVINQFAANGWLTSVTAPTFSQYGGSIPGALALSMGNPNAGGTIYYTLDGSDPRSVGGAIAPGAIPYAGAVGLTASTHVRARVLNAGVWSAITDETFVTTESFPLRIVELNYNPVGTSEVTEFIELVNTSAASISLDGVQIGGFSTIPYVFQAGQSLAGGERIVVARNPTDFVAAYGSGIRLAAGSGYAEANLSNGGELVTLSGPVGELLQSFTYADLAPWPTAADGAGPSLEYVGPLHAGEDPATGAPADPFDVGANWRASLNNGGSPGTDGDPAPSADFDGSLLVDGSDFLAWQRGFGVVAPTFAQGDADRNGSVDGADLSIWGQQFGSAGAVAALQSAVVAAAPPLNSVESLGAQVVAVAQAVAADGAEPATTTSGLISPSESTTERASCAAFDAAFAALPPSRRSLPPLAAAESAPPHRVSERREYRTRVSPSHGTSLAKWGWR